MIFLYWYNSYTKDCSGLEEKFFQLGNYTAIAFRIMNTIHVTVAGGERSFAELKMIKNYISAQQ